MKYVVSQVDKKTKAKNLAINVGLVAVAVNSALAVSSICNSLVDVFTGRNFYDQLARGFEYVDACSKADKDGNDRTTPDEWAQVHAILGLEFKNEHGYNLSTAQLREYNSLK